MPTTNVPALDAWLEYLRNTNKSENTLRSYRQRVISFAEWFESINGDVIISERVTPTDLREYKSTY